MNQSRPIVFVSVRVDAAIDELMKIDAAWAEAMKPLEQTHYDHGDRRENTLKRAFGAWRHGLIAQGRVPFI